MSPSPTLISTFERVCRDLPISLGRRIPLAEARVDGGTTTVEAICGSAMWKLRVSRRMSLTHQGLGAPEALLPLIGLANVPIRTLTVSGESRTISAESDLFTELSTLLQGDLPFSIAGNGPTGRVVVTLFSVRRSVAQEGWLYEVSFGATSTSPFEENFQGLLATVCDIAVSLGESASTVLSAILDQAQQQPQVSAAQSPAPAAPPSNGAHTGDGADHGQAESGDADPEPEPEEPEAGPTSADPRVIALQAAITEDWAGDGFLRREMRGEVLWCQQNRITLWATPPSGGDPVKVMISLKDGKIAQNRGVKPTGAGAKYAEALKKRRR